MEKHRSKSLLKWGFAAWTAPGSEPHAIILLYFKHSD